MSGNRNGNGRRSPWWYKRENILMALGIGVIVGEFVSSVVFLRTFHYEWLIGGLALCGVGFTLPRGTG